MIFNKIILTIALIFAMILNSCKDNDSIVDPKLKKGWYSQLSGTSNDLYHVFFIDKNEGWVLGKSVLLHTIDGGLNWYIIYENTLINHDSYNICFQSSKIGWIYGAHVFKTTDGGITWTDKLPGNNMVDFIKFFDVNNGYLCDGYFYKTSDGGRTWNLLMDSILNYDFVSGVVVDANTLLGFANSKIFYKSTDAGDNWVRYSMESELDDSFYTMQFLDINLGFYGAGSGIFKTTDGGINWTKVYSTSSYQYINKIQFVNSSIGWAVNSIFANDHTFSILYTNDRGNTWSQQKTNTDNTLNSVFFLNTKNGWVVGDNGTILHTDTGGIE